MKKIDVARPLAWSIAALSVTLIVSDLAISLVAAIQSRNQGLLTSDLLSSVYRSMTTMTYVLVGALVAARQPRNPIGWLFSIEGVLFGLTLLTSDYTTAGQSSVARLPGIEIAEWLSLWLWIPTTMIPLTFLILLFPDGRLPSPRWRPIAWSAGLALGVYIVATALHPHPSVDPAPRDNPFGIPSIAGALDLLGNVILPLLIVGTFGAPAALVVRFRRSRGIEREQLKWLAYAGVMAILGISVMSAWSAFRPDDPTINDLTLTVVWVGLSVIAIAAGIAILRYRLYDIDIIIRRTLIYSVLTLMLGLIYLGCIIMSRILIAPLTGGSDLAIVASTLAIAALFNPLRRRIQNLIDKRFYRRKYDAAKVLAAFSTTARDETGLERLTTEMLRVVDETMQPEFVGLWLREPATRSTLDSARPDSTLPQ